MKYLVSIVILTAIAIGVMSSPIEQRDSNSIQILSPRTPPDKSKPRDFRRVQVTFTGRITKCVWGHDGSCDVLACQAAGGACSEKRPCRLLFPGEERPEACENCQCVDG